MIEEQYGTLTRYREKEQGIKRHESVPLRKETFDKLIREFSCKKAHKALL